jgi:N-acetylglutamate synthase-like GNAT family acetyltransferase
MDYLERQRDDYRILTDPQHFDLDAIHAYLTRSYWAEGIPRQLVERAIAGSMGFGLFHGKEQVGFARVITDRATFAYLCDVYVLEAHRGKGLSKWLVEVVQSHPELQGLRRFILATRDAHGLYAQYGFTPLARPETFMEIVRPGLYKPPAP